MSERPKRRPKPFEALPFASLPDQPKRAHRYLELEAREVSVRVDGSRVRMRYRELGEGTPLVLVHGLMTSGYSFRYVTHALAERGFRVLVPDLPGAGESEPLAGPHGARQLTEALGAFLEAAGARGGLVIGNSMGGYLAMRLALEDPGAMARLCNVHSPVLPIPRLRALHLALRPVLTRRLLGRVVALSPERWVHRNVHYRDETLKSREEAGIYAAPLRTPGGRRAFASWLGDGLDPAELSQLVVTLARRASHREGFPVPLQLVYARTDPMVPPEMGEALHRLVPQAEMIWLEESSHFAHVDTPEAFLEAAVPFLRG